MSIKYRDVLHKLTFLLIRTGISSIKCYNDNVDIRSLMKRIFIHKTIYQGIILMLVMLFVVSSAYADTIRIGLRAHHGITNIMVSLKV